MKRRQLLTLLAVTGTAACGTSPAATTATATPSGAPVSVPAPATTERLGPALTATSPPPSPSTSVSPPVTGKPGVMLGSYLALGGRTLRQSLALRRRQLSREQRIVHRFYPWDGYLPASEPDVAAASRLMVSWHGAPWAGILDGGSDAMIRSVARKLKAMDRPILLRWGWEMNGDWFAWSGAANGQDPAGYVTAWRRLHRIFADQGATNVSWIWSPNWNSSPDVPWNRMQSYYPGDAYVDWVGVSGYNFYGESPSTLFGPVTRRYGGRKPIILSETSAVRDRARYIERLHTWVADTPAVGAVVWFDTDIQEGTDHDFRIDADPSALAAYRSMAQDPYFNA
ncbi:glycoside hydrolase family 26 protein [Actinoplanes subglobosus]|uniref:Glycoside hydrolase family 26 protein n=1 Tax=Actinoplanes subglobosus TaxID=1547892 RepID=A0ABV8J7D8_9ACTN